MQIGIFPLRFPMFPPGSQATPDEEMEKIKELEDTLTTTCAAGILLKFGHETVCNEARNFCGDRSKLESSLCVHHGIGGSSQLDPLVIMGAPVVDGTDGIQ